MEMFYHNVTFRDAFGEWYQRAVDIYAIVRYIALTMKIFEM